MKVQKYSRSHGKFISRDIPNFMFRQHQEHLNPSQPTSFAHSESVEKRLTRELIAAQLLEAVKAGYETIQRNNEHGTKGEKERKGTTGAGTKFYH